MIDYTGLSCPVCGQAFQPSDDIVVCPQCGAPHHRECYAKVGHCALADKHGTEQEWCRQEHPFEKAPTKECPRCHAKNEEDALYCKECGQSLHYYSKAVGEQPTEPAGASQTPPYQNTPPFWGPFPGANPQGAYPGNPMDPLGGVAPNEQFDGVDAQDMAKTVRTNTRYYLPVFARYKLTNQCRFNFAAFLFGGAWFLFRKMYLPGILFIAIKTALVLGNILTQTLFLFPMLQSLGLPANFSMFQMQQILPKIMERGSGTVFLCILPLILYIGDFILSIVMGILGNRLYYRHCVDLVKRIRTETSDAAVCDAALEKRGGVNIALASALLACYIAAYFLPSYFL